MTNLTFLHLGLNPGHFGMLVAALFEFRFQFRVPIKIGLFGRVKMVCTRPSTADIPAIKEM